MAQILSTRMMLDWLGQPKAAAAIEGAVVDVLREGRVLTPDLGGRSSTRDVAEAVKAKILSKES
jgi:isocitrate/isopropylmalate dehydrogenase